MVDADQAQEEAAAARLEADRLIRYAHPRALWKPRLLAARPLMEVEPGSWRVCLLLQ